MTDLPQVGQAAPDFAAKDSNGTEVSLASREDRWTILYFYSKDNTPGCTTEAQEFSEYKERFSALKLEVKKGIEVSIDNCFAKKQA